MNSSLVRKTKQTYFICRHQGSIEWAKRKGISVDAFLEHMENINDFKAGDTVIGSLPVHIIAQLNAKGVRFVHFQLDLPNHLRGVELSADDIDSLNIQLNEYIVWSMSRQTVNH